jgi:hypothetical protein
VFEDAEFMKRFQSELTTGTKRRRDLQQKTKKQKKHATGKREMSAGNFQAENERPAADKEEDERRVR